MYPQFEEDVTNAVESFIVLSGEARKQAFTRIYLAYTDAGANEKEHELFLIRTE